MYFCLECKRSFLEPAVSLEPRDYGESVVYERWLECPWCGGECDGVATPSQ